VPLPEDHTVLPMSGGRCSLSSELPNACRHASCRHPDPLASRIVCAVLPRSGCGYAAMGIGHCRRSHDLLAQRAGTVNQMNRNQILSSGLIIRQDIANSIRFVFFETGIPEWRYATEGGTAFIINYRGKPYGLTARHVLKGFAWPQLAITDKKIGTKKTGIKAVYFPSSPNSNTIETEVLDVLLIEFGPEVGPGHFEDTAYILNTNTVATSQDGHTLLVAGVLKETSEITETELAPQFCQLEFTDNGATKSDPTLRHAISEFANPDFTKITGLSGSPVFDITANALCGMVVRGGMSGNECNLRYVDIFDIMQMIESVHSGKAATNYTKVVAFNVT
jgi:hypothetical protein